MLIVDKTWFQQLGDEFYGANGGPLDEIHDNCRFVYLDTSNCRCMEERGSVDATRRPIMTATTVNRFDLS